MGHQSTPFDLAKNILEDRILHREGQELWKFWGHRWGPRGEIYPPGRFGTEIIRNGKNRYFFVTTYFQVAIYNLKFWISLYKFYNVTVFQFFQFFRFWPFRSPLKSQHTWRCRMRSWSLTCWCAKNILRNERKKSKILQKISNAIFCT